MKFAGDYSRADGERRRNEKAAVWCRGSPSKTCAPVVFRFSGKKKRGGEGKVLLHGDLLEVYAGKEGKRGGIGMATAFFLGQSGESVYQL